MKRNIFKKVIFILFTSYLSLGFLACGSSSAGEGGIFSPY